MRPELENVTIEDHQAARLEEWVEANKTARGWLDSYALGKTYIDSRANGGKGITARRRYVSLDHAVAKEVPELAGYHAEDIKAFLAARTLKAELTEEEPTGLRM
ncbi:hypothetical protein [Rhizobium sp. MHM7A]|uniref:hypothetical protein n=1 Tax=Rhizobium sp. MHM7A TaxID=2583233 RepID=UPI001106E67A|nr:hypothetical protein [Rhizobium sp. MHM7A]TLX16288.1 hypothetical protein FFR93_02870 [Rhizobium sp. MHM7A]